MPQRVYIYRENPRKVKPGLNNGMTSFKPTYLYIKQHNKTGLKYFGKTVRPDPYRYKGSGKYWKNHLCVHGNDVTTVWVQLFTDPVLLTEYALTFSTKNNIVKSSDWANLKSEDGLSGGAMPWTEESRQKLSKTLTGRSPSVTHRANLSIALKGHKDFRTPEVKAIAGVKASAKLKGKKKPIGFGEAVGNRLRGSKMADSAVEKMKAAWTNERKEQQAERARIQNASRSVIICPHCSLQGTNPGNMKRYHYDNCKCLQEPRHL